MAEKTFKAFEFVDYCLSYDFYKAIGKFESEIKFQPDNKTVQKGIFEF
jgi:hypothetical protein